VINGASGTGLWRTYFATLTGIFKGFYFSWRMSVLCIGISPLMIITGYMGDSKV
jgi:hypothetical protein